MSPLTRSAESTCTSSPSRITVEMGDCNDESADTKQKKVSVGVWVIAEAESGGWERPLPSSASFALFSVTAAIVALIRTIIRMAMESM